MKTQRIHYKPICVILMLFLVCSIACNEVRNVTYSEHIAQIIFENCSSCHRPHESGPFPLTNYKEVFKYAEMIKEVTQNRYMPPWSADPAYSHFLNEKRLTDQEIEQITRWVDRGAPLGDSSKIPEAPVFHNNSSIGKPDLVLKMTQPYVIPPDGEDKFKVFIFPIHIRKDTIVKAMEFVPGNKKLVHHVWYFEDTTNYFSTLDSLLPGYAFNFFEGNDYLPIPPEILVVYPELSELKTTSTKHLMDGGAGYIPGSSTQIYPPGIGRLLRANTTLLMQIHYSGTGLKSEDLSRLNLFFAREPIERHTQFILLEEDNITNSPFTIPAGEVKNFQSSQLITQDISILSIAPHMHYRGTKIKAYSVNEDGDTLNLIRINNWDFNWQGIYYFEHLMKIVANSTIYLEGTFDNTSENPFNPILPPKDVKWNLSSKDEMFGVFIEWIPYKIGDEQLQMLSDHHE